MIDNQLQEELRERYNPDGSVLRKAQLRMLDMLTFLDEVCEENNLTYWLDSGTLLGAVRHGGFIPWDNDADICMPRKDMLKLEKILKGKKYSNSQFQLQCSSSDPGFFEFWDVLRDTKSEYLINKKIHQRRKFKGIQVDIFPVESSVDPKLQKTIKWLSSRIIGRLVDTVMPNWIINIPYCFINKLVIPCFRIKGKQSTADQIYYGYGLPFLKKYPKSCLNPIEKIKFEDRYFNAPFDYDTYLSALYGNWRELPSKDKRFQDSHTSNITFRED